MRQDLAARFRTESKIKYVVAALIVIGLIAAIFVKPRGAEFNKAVERELQLARAICINAENWVFSNIEKLKLNEAILDHIPVNGRKVELKEVKYPQIIFLIGGFRSPNMPLDLSCEIKDPRGGQKYYYNYEKKLWTDKVRFRR